MQYLILLILSFNITQASVTGVTEACPVKAQLIANEGEKFVTVRMNGKDEKLTSVSGAPFSLQAKDPVTFRNKKLKFEMTSVVMSSLPRLVLYSAGMKKQCMVKLNE